MGLLKTASESEKLIFKGTVVDYKKLKFAGLKDAILNMDYNHLALHLQPNQFDNSGGYYECYLPDTLTARQTLINNGICAVIETDVNRENVKKTDVSSTTANVVTGIWKLKYFMQIGKGLNNKDGEIYLIPLGTFSLKANGYAWAVADSTNYGFNGDINYNGIALFNTIEIW